MVTNPKVSLMNVLMAKPSMYSKSLVLNILGMQIYRILFFYLYRVLRPTKKISSKYKGYLEKLETDGIAIIPNFFTDEDYKKLFDEYSRLEPEFEQSLSSIQLPHVYRIKISDNRVSEFFRKSFLENAVIREMPTAYFNRKYNLPVEAFLTKIYCRNQEEIDSPKNGGTNNVHFDAPTRVFKIFYYFTDTDENNAALRYYKGSRKRNTLKRLWYEYRLSIRYALNKRNFNHGGEYKDGEPWVKVQKEDVEKLGYKEESMNVKGNTLVLANVGAFHRRGECRTTTPRRTVEINFRSIDTIRNEIYPLEKILLNK